MNIHPSFCLVIAVLLGVGAVSAVAAEADGGHGMPPAHPDDGRFVVLGYNDLGMHCINQDFSQFMILPPFNTLHAQVVERRPGGSVVVTDEIEVRYEIPGNTHSADKTNFWEWAQDLLGVALPPDVGLTGNRLAGTMAPTGNGDWSATGIPLTPMTDLGRFDPFQLARVTVSRDGVDLATTRPVTPVSWDLRCDLCHHGAPDAPVSVLDAHDLLHGTSLFDPATGGPAGGKPVLCGGCHAQPELGLPGDPARENLSRAMHRAHGPRMMDVAASVPKGVVCYACHPGPAMPCLRDVHARMQMTCKSCHAPQAADWVAAMEVVAAPDREPWVSEPRCENCHRRAGSEYEQAGALFRNSKGHGGMFCEACHDSTHAITPARDAADNVQSISLQNHPGAIRKCTVCHLEQPNAAFRHGGPPV